MNATAYFIQDRAQSLVFEALQHPKTTPTTMAWFRLALDWAEKHNCLTLAHSLRLDMVLLQMQETHHVPV